MLITDAHLDLAYNAVRGREVLRPAMEQTADSEGIPTVGLPDLLAGGVRLVCATIFCAPDEDPPTGFRTPDEAMAAAERQWAWYAAQQAAGLMQFAGSGVELLQQVNASAQNGAAPLSALLLMEGADPLRNPADVEPWFARGLRIVGLAWRKSRYAGGTGNPGPLSAEAAPLIAELDRLGIIHDASHLAEESFWQLLELSAGPVIASHSNCRAIVPTDRQLSDKMIHAIFKRDGVIGINFFDRFLLSPADYATKRRATLEDVVNHVKHLCDIAGDELHVGLGTDMDGGLGREEIPQEILTSADLPKVADALSAGGFGDEAIDGITGKNWLEYFRHYLPK